MRPYAGADYNNLPIYLKTEQPIGKERQLREGKGRGGS
jgi:hypothetical protein